MKNSIRKFLPVIPTLLLVAVAVPIAQHLWNYYTNAPWTRDGHIGAEVVQVAPDVSGLITQVDIEDNQLVKRGQLLFLVDRSRYELAVQQAEAVVRQQRASLGQARREAARNHVLADLVAKEVLEDSDARVQQGEASLARAESALALARLNLARTEVRSPVDGYLNDRVPRDGDYVSAGRPVLSVVDQHSFHVVGYFEETKLDGVHIDQPVDIRIMGSGQLLRGHVQSVAAGIEDRDRVNGESLLPNVNPTFNWVRLAQRIPVRVALDEVPADFRLIAGRTATVSVREVERP
ncbi:RND family efflux transporter, MFP subunit [Pseudomonas citronellolis]|uniref:RND family efflux transporter, MFP subunit n=1 Tax=Pseudomonas citronellolis TaxID=53408 RepID=A0AAQ1KQ31_9PSED|nr:MULTISPECIES: HlyD family secretion protein [Pseudomonas]MCL6692474.1 HlyD family secretion protein [Pseudomonas sp. R3.Fl]MCP1607824.1 RND family efflux transporter MFP subunit [Pseudomonas citronellolis]MCP1658815.1 RND family efflux transporter MFP subunit [Pseudomonas citronellolis]MCP1725764.1 RND family efflux transporter MFP subunit [Pseudomonas citronellolis]MDN6876492.1 HlyD family secretion protein [Pseudomonas citronellolis]